MMDRGKLIALILAGVVLLAGICVVTVGLTSGVWPWTPKATAGGDLSIKDSDPTSGTKDTTEGTTPVETGTEPGANGSTLPYEEGDVQVPVVIITDPKPGNGSTGGGNTGGGSTSGGSTGNGNTGSGNTGSGNTGNGGTGGGNTGSGNTGSGNTGGGGTGSGSTEDTQGADFVVDFKDLIKNKTNQ